MSSHRKSRLILGALLALMVVPPISILANIPWLKQQPDELALLLSGIASTLTIVASFFLAVIADRQSDEWQRSNARFSTQWGWTAGTCLVALLLNLPPFRDLVVSLVANWAEAPNPDRKHVVLTFTFGFMAILVAQALCIVLLSFGWIFWKSRSAREPS